MRVSNLFFQRKFYICFYSTVLPFINTLKNADLSINHYNSVFTNGSKLEMELNLIFYIAIKNTKILQHKIEDC